MLMCLLSFISSPPSSCVVWNSNSAWRAYLGDWPPHPPQPFPFRIAPTHTQPPLPTTATTSKTHTLTHTIAETLFSNHAKPLGSTIQAGPNLKALVQSRGWKLKSGIDWLVATGAS